MQLIQTSFKEISRLTNSLSRRCIAVIVVSMTIVAVISIFLPGVPIQSENKVYAVRASDVGSEEISPGEIPSGKLQAGLMGIMNSVNSMEEYSIAASSVDITNENEKVLVGTAKVRRNALNKISMGKGMKKIGGIGYFAQQTVRKNHMDTNDYYSLLQIVEAEATGGDIKSKILIANVVLNRVLDSHFPNTIYDVVWDREGGAAQFSPTADGRIYTVEITEDTYEAVDRALKGEDYSQGAIFFMARSSAEMHNKEWFDKTLQRLFEYGGHEYYKLVG